MVQTDYSGFVVPFAREKVPEVFAPGHLVLDELRRTFIRTSKISMGFWLTRAIRHDGMIIRVGWMLRKCSIDPHCPAWAIRSRAAWQTEPMIERIFLRLRSIILFRTGSVDWRGARGSCKAQQRMEQVLGSETIRLWDDR